MSRPQRSVWFFPFRFHSKRTHHVRIQHQYDRAADVSITTNRVNNDRNVETCRKRRHAEIVFTKPGRSICRVDLSESLKEVSCLHHSKNSEASVAHPITVTRHRDSPRRVDMTRLLLQLRRV